MKNTKPNVILHMMEHGMLGGTYLGLLTWLTILLGLLGIYIYNASDLSLLFGGLLVIALYALPIMFLISTSSLILGLVGMMFGMFNGLLLRNITERIPFPTKDEQFIWWHIATTVINAALITTLFASFIILYFGFSMGWFSLLLLSPVIFIALAASYTTHRYMLKLQTWSRDIKKAKNKAKRPPNNNLSYTDNLHPDWHIHIETQQQVEVKQD